MKYMKKNMEQHPE
jgi:hypothetical protein